MELSKAKKAGYNLCKSCKADDVKTEANKPKEVKASTPGQFKQKADAAKLSSIGKNNPGLLNALKGL